VRDDEQDVPLDNADYCKDGYVILGFKNAIGV